MKNSLFACKKSLLACRRKSLLACRRMKNLLAEGCLLADACEGLRMFAYECEQEEELNYNEVYALD